MFMVGFVITPLNGFYPTFLQSVGYKTLFLGTASAMFGITMIVSKLFVGGIIDYFGIRRATFYLYILPIAATVSALLVTTNPASAILFVALLGIGNPLGTVPLPLWVISIFGQENYKLTYSRVQGSWRAAGSTERLYEEGLHQKFSKNPPISSALCYTIRCEIMLRRIKAYAFTGH